MNDSLFTSGFDAAGHEPDAGAESFERTLRSALGAFEPVPEPPRDLMWARIAAARRPRRGSALRRLVTGAWPGSAPSRQAAGAHGSAPRRVAALRGRVALLAGVAAVLALGIGIGRSSLLLRAPAGASVGATAAGAAPDAMLPYRVAAVQHLTRTEALLTSLPSSAASGAADEVSAWAGELLAQTRLLLDSPAGQDAELGLLLADLELLLAQVAALSAARGVDELDLIRDGIDQNDVMFRLRTATMVRPFVGT